MPVLNFTTDDYARRDRIEATRDVYSAVANIELSPTANDHFALQTDIKILPGVTISRITSTPMEARRSACHLSDGQ